MRKIKKIYFLYIDRGYYHIILMIFKIKENVSLKTSRLSRCMIKYNNIMTPVVTEVYFNH